MFPDHIGATLGARLHPRPLDIRPHRRVQNPQCILDTEALGGCAVRSKLCCSPRGGRYPRQPQALQRAAPTGVSETGHPGLGRAGPALHPWLPSLPQPSPAPSCKTAIPSLSQFLNPEPSPPLIPHTFTGTVQHESLPSVKVIFSRFKKSTYSSYYSEDEKKSSPLFLA